MNEQLATHLAEVGSILETTQQAAVDATALADNASPADCRRSYAVLATGIARARHQLCFVVALMNSGEGRNAN
jgi:hypothetical protein